ncbi:hypothetical protein [Micromonospora haikouensis]|uniref:hypothetical protein n=1 Tax=Micromonospora haikouensis TaxID=686309 RepID=UPI003D74B530
MQSQTLPEPTTPPARLTPEHTTPASLGAALRRAAADIEALGDIQLSPTLISLNLQAVRHGGSEDERKTAVDVLARALAGPDAPMETTEGTHRLCHWAPRAGGDDMWFSVYTGLDREDGDR